MKNIRLIDFIIFHIDLIIIEPFYGFMVWFNSQNRLGYKCSAMDIRMGHLNLHIGIYHK